MDGCLLRSCGGDAGRFQGGGGTAQGMLGCSYRDWPPDGDVYLLGGYEILTQREKSGLET